MLQQFDTRTRQLQTRITLVLQANRLTKCASHPNTQKPTYCVTPTYWEPCHSQNFTIFRILAYFGPEELFFHNVSSQQSDKILNTPVSKSAQNLRLCTISGILRTQGYSEPCLFRHIQAYSMVIVIVKLIFFYFNLTQFSTKFKKIYIFLTTVTLISILDQVYLNNAQSFKITL